MNDRLDKFTERAKKVLVYAQDEATRFNHNYIGTEHLLLGLLREGEGIAARVLSNLGVELNKVRSAVEFIIGRGERMVVGEISLTPRAKRVIELSIEEARRLGKLYIETDVWYGRLQQEGGKIDAQYQRKARKGGGKLSIRSLATSRGRSRAVSALLRRALTGPGLLKARNVRLPPRRFIGVSKGDRRGITKLLRETFQKAAR